MISVFVVIGALLSFFNGKIIRISLIIGYLIAFFLIILGSLGIIDKNGLLEHEANEFISGSTGLPLEEIEKFEGVKPKN